MRLISPFSTWAGPLPLPPLMLQQHAGGFVIRVLRHKFALKCLAQGGRCQAFHLGSGRQHAQSKELFIMLLEVGEVALKCGGWHR